MSDMLGARYTYHLLDDEFVVESISPDSYAVIAFGEYRAEFGTLRASLVEIAEAMKLRKEYSEDQIRVATNLNNWNQSSFDLFDPAEV